MVISSTVDCITGTILENLLHPGVAVAEPTGMEREKMVQIFIRHLLLALEQMHGLRIAHLDLRPETILMQDGKLKLADFGQSRRLLRGLITGTIRSNPEFVSPEVVRGYPLTLATDLWSVGALAYVLLTGISPFHGDNDNETMANVDKAKVDFNGPEWSSFSEDSKHFVSQLLREIPAERMTCGEALDHRWLNEGDVKDAQLPADGLREFNYKFKWLERRVFVQQTPSEQLLEAILAPSTAVAAQQPKPPAEGAGALELYDYLRIKPRSPAPVEELAPRRKQPSGPVVPEGFSDFPADYLPPGSLPPPPEYHPRDPRRRPDTSPDRFGPQGQPSGKKEKIPLDQFGRLVRAEDLARIPHDSFGRPLDLDQQFPREDPRGNLGPIQQIPPFRGQKEGEKKGERPPPPEYSMSPEKRKLIPQEKGETPSKTRKEPRREGEEREEDAPKVPTRMIRGERRQIEEEIANRILSDISEEGSVAGSLASIDDLEPMLYEQQRRRHSPSATPHAESEVSTPTASPVNTIKEGNFFPKDADPSQYPKIDTESVQHLPRHERELLERAENDPNIPIGAPLFLEGLTNTTLQIETAPLPSPALSPKSPRRSAPGTKSPVLLSPGREHTMEALIAMKRGKPQFLKPGETAPEIDDEDAHMDKRKQKAKPQTHDSGFKDLQEELDKKRKTDLDDLEKYRPRNFYKDDVDFQRPGYDIDDSPWDSHYQIGPDTYLMAAQGPSFNSRVRDYRRTLWGEGAPLVRQGFLGYRNQDITVRERRRYTDIMREMMNGLQPKQTADSNSVMRAPSATAVDRILADIKNVAPSATKKNADGTYAPIFVSRLRDAYLGHASAIFEASVAGSPQPKIQWNFQGKPLESDDRRRIEQIGNIFRLTIQNPTAFDLGEYSCLATNEFGTDKTTSRLVSGEAPSRPGRPDCELSSDTEIFITWQPPEGPTYLEGITYRLEYRPADPANLAAPWVVISEHIDDEAVVIKHLEPMGVYQFRVTARNGVGLGIPSLSSRMVQTHGRGVPKLQVDILKDHYRLNVVTLPQKSARQLNEISEESESEHGGDGQQSEEIIELSTKEPSERFQIDALLCRGKFSVLRAAIDGKTEGSAQCVVKIRDSKDADSKREFNLLKESQHENVQRLVAGHDCNGFLYLFCERLYEDVFSRFAFNDYYTEEQVAMTVRQLTSAIHYLHFRGIAHLDINPYNVMFQTKRNWIVKLVDFHSAQELSSAVKPTDINVLWAAPEMHVPEAPVTVQSDVWGMAAITFCLLGGFHPFYSEYDKPEDIKENVLNTKCDPNLIPVTASQEVLSFVTWGLKKSPIRRMRTDEALSHKFLSADPSMVRRREASKYSASRLRKTISLTLPQPARPISNELNNKYGEKNIQ